MDAVPDIVDAVLIFLALLSVLIWTIGIGKFVVFYRSSRHDRHFLQAYAKAAHVHDVLALVKTAQGRLVRICQAGLDELTNLQRASAMTPQDRREMLLHALRSQSHTEVSRMESGLAVLASVGSTAPFIGLFGTVWGIMHALKNISATGSAGLDVVAGPIGEALIATAIGIATAVPAVLAYNYFLRKVRTSAAAMDIFASSFQNLVTKSGMKGE